MVVNNMALSYYSVMSFSIFRFYINCLLNYKKLLHLTNTLKSIFILLITSSIGIAYNAFSITLTIHKCDNKKCPFPLQGVLYLNVCPTSFILMQINVNASLFDNELIVSAYLSFQVFKLYIQYIMYYVYLIKEYKLLYT